MIRSCTSKTISRHNFDSLHVILSMQSCARCTFFYSFTHFCSISVHLPPWVTLFWMIAVLVVSHSALENCGLGRCILCIDSLIPSGAIGTFWGCISPLILLLILRFNAQIVYMWETMIPALSGKHDLRDWCRSFFAKLSRVSRGRVGNPLLWCCSFGYRYFDMKLNYKSAHHLLITLAFWTS